VPPMPTMLEPGIRPVLPGALEEEDIPIPPVALKEGAMRAGLSAPMQGGDGTVPADAAGDVDPIGLAAPMPPSWVAPRGPLTPAIADASFDDEAPVVAVEQAGEALQIPDVETPAMGANPDRAVRPRPSKLELLLGDPAGHGGVRDSVPTLSGAGTAIPVAPPIRLVCGKPGLAASRNRPAVSGSNKVIWRTLQPSCHTSNNDPSPRDMAMPFIWVPTHAVGTESAKRETGAPD
jgi:hypothetical protein